MINEVLSFIHLHLLWFSLGGGAAATAAAAYGLYSAHRRKVLNTPNSYFIRALSREQVEKLSQAAIAFSTSEVDGETSAMFDSGLLKQVLQALDARVASGFPLQGKQIHELILHFKQPKNRELDAYTVKFSGKSGIPNFRVARVVKDMLLGDLRRDIVIHNLDETGGHNDGAFHIYLHNTPGSARGGVRNPEKIWSAPSTSTLNSYSPSGHGAPFVDEHTDFFVGELVGNDRLYIYTDVLNNNGAKNDRFFKRIWTKIKFWGPDPRLGLLLRILQRVKQDLTAENSLNEIIAKLKAEGGLPNVAAATNFQVTDEGFVGRRQDVIKGLVRDILLPVVGSNVHIVHCAGQAKEPIADPSFHIYFYSAPTGKAFMDVPERFWGYRLYKRDKAFAPSPYGVTIVEDNGYIVGELVDRSLYLHQELIQYGTRGEAALFAKMLMEVRKNLLEGTTVQEAVEAQLHGECLRQRQTAVSGKSKGETADARKAQEEFHAGLRLHIAAQEELYRTEAAPSEELGREFDAICSIPKVTDVKVTKDHIVVKTVNLYCTDSRTNHLHDIGEFEIYIPVGGAGGVQWFNKTRRIKNFNAPHVNSDGNPCLGNMKDVLPNLIAKREFASVIEIAIAFVESVNVNDTWGTNIQFWPVAHK